MRITKAVCSLFALALAATFTLGSASDTAHADPCGMVPPLVIPENQVAIKRVGAQKTFVTHYRGVETMVLRPAFEGKTDEFGMLIPFPSPPAMRKVDDNIFAQVAAAVEPPEIVANVWRGRRFRRSKSAQGAAPSMDAEGADEDDKLSFNTVRVVNREAVGMYDVAVLEAGSAMALKRWMDKNGFRYPKGMDKVTQEYVDIGWFFVAVKTQVGDKSGVNPRPGMRKAKPRLPKNASFNGAVQAMGFRFKTKELVVPMRLSAFNAGKLRNIVYVLTDKPSRIKRIPKRYVVRQISGRELYRNITGPLPLRVFGGTFKDLTKNQRQQLKTNRKPDRYNGIAKDLFAGDMLAIRRGRLSNPIEEKEKQLLAIGESLGLRGKNIDALHRTELKKQTGRAEARALRTIRNMHLTVIDGEFQREVLAKENLKFASYRMPRHRNNKRSYDASQARPGSSRGGVLYRSSVDDLEKQLGPNADRAASLDPTPKRSRGWLLQGGIGLGVLVLFGLGIRRRRTSAILAGLVIMGLAAPSAMANRAQAIADLSQADRAKAAVNKLVRMGEPAVDDLVDFVVDSQDTSARGWAIVALGKIGGLRADAALQAIHQQNAQPMLVRTWAAAARIEMAKSPQRLINLANLASQFPSTARPLAMKLSAHLARDKGPKKAERLFDAATRIPALRTELQAVILALPSRDLVNALISGKNNQVRRMAAQYLATVASKRKDIGRAVINAVRFNTRAKQPPWGTSMALFLPGMQWQQAEARQLVGQLMRWHLWADVNGQNGIQQQIHNNLRSVALIRAAGYRNPGWSNINTIAWLKIWKDTVGVDAVRAMLREQKVAGLRRYQAVFDR